MKGKLHRSGAEAFTLVELMVIVAVLGILSGVAFTAMAKSKTRSPAIGCLSNLRQLMTGWSAYAEDNNGSLMPNSPAGGSGTNCWCKNVEGWAPFDGNTNPVYYLNFLMGPYVSSNITVFRCPGDVVPSQNGLRLRSYSMNGQVGITVNNFNPGYRLYTKEADLTCPQPKDTFIFCDESPYSLNDGFLQTSLSSPRYPDLPASYLEGGCGFSFADGHAEIHKWRSQFIQLPVIYGVGGGNVASSGLDSDWSWLRDHSACLQ